MTSTDKLGAVNIALMLLSLALAFIIPFELLIIAYAVLGPLHYITEINWLNSKGFYLRTPSTAWLLAALTLLMSLPVLAMVFQDSISGLPWLQYFLLRLKGNYVFFLFVALVLSLALVLFYRWSHVATLLLVAAFSALFLRHWQPYLLIVGILLTSVLHVYFFTLLFVVHAALRSPTKVAVAELVVMTLIPLVILMLPNPLPAIAPGQATIDILRESGFESLNRSLARLFSFAESNTVVLTGRIQIFLAFAYLYHYLNWFSKVSLIGWLKGASASRIVVICLLWVSAVGLYLFDYKAGLKALFFLSLLHVVLEFPLNMLTAGRIGVLLRKRTSKLLRHGSSS